MSTYLVVFHKSFWTMKQPSVYSPPEGGVVYACEASKSTINLS